MTRNKGSEWHKWDLHIHTPETKRNNNFKGSGDTESNWIKFCEKLNKSGIQGVGITDYFAVDNYEKLVKNREKWNLDSNILILPNIELRLSDIRSKRTLSREEKENIGEKKYNSFANVHIIFSNEVKIDKIKRFLSKLPTTKRGERLDFGDPRKIDWYKIEHYPNTKELKDALKDSNIDRHDYLIMDAAGEDGIANDPDVNGYDDCVSFFLNNVDIKQIQSGESSIKSDLRYYQQTLPNWCKNHNRKYYLCPCVIASDAHSFENIGGKYTYIKSDLSFNGLRQIKFEPEVGERISYNEPEIRNNSQIIDSVQYGRNEVCFNSGLNTIIGGRSTGKSTLINTIYKYQDNILNIDNQEQDDGYYYLHKGNDTDVQIKWKDGSVDSAKKIIFIPQDYMIKIADSGNPTRLNDLIKKMLTMGNGVGRSREEDFKDRIIDLKSRMRDLTIKINNLLDQKNKLLKPNVDKKSIENDINEFNKLINEAKLKNSDDKIDDAIKLVREKKEEISKYSSEVSELKADLEILKNNTNEIFFKEFKENIKDIEDQLSSSIKDSYIKDIGQDLEKFIKSFNENNNRYIETLNERIKEKEEKINNIKEDNEYKNSEEIIDKEKHLKELISKRDESKEKLNTIVTYKENINKIESKLKNIYDEIIENFYTMINLVGKSEEIYNGEFTIYVKYSGIHFEDLIDYYRKKRSNIDLIDEYNKELDSEHIHHDTIKKLFEITFKANKNTMDLLNDLVNNDWLKIDYGIRYENDDFYSMSQGKKSFVILKMLLEFNKDNNPIIIDQPEDSLDNRAIYKDLTSYLKKKKKTCQIIVVTHNANIVIGADSENVIIANQNSEKMPNANKEKFMYINGSIESNDADPSQEDFLRQKTIREHIFEILEGGNEAFKKREDRYHM